MENRIAWIRFQQIFGYGTVRAGKILDRLGHPSALFAETEARLGQLGFTQVELERFRTTGSEEEARKILDRCYKKDCRLLTPDDPDYPQRLREIYSFPAVLYLRGSLSGLDDCLAIGMVGTRVCTDYGRRAARTLAGELAEKGVVIVSGMARGIDTVSHTAALRAGGRTIAVLGCGIDIVYPPENLQLEETILQYGGAVVTEYPPGTQPLPRHFPVRNRIISGLSNGVVVVEGTRHSGSLITAGHAFAQNRDVFAVPGNIFSPASQGPNYLLRQNAKAVDGVESILEEYQFLIQWETPEEPIQKSLFEELEKKGYNEEQRPLEKTSAKRKPAQQEVLPAYLTEVQQKIYAVLTSGEVFTADHIAARSGLPLPGVLAALTQMEIFGIVKIHPGRRFSL